MKVLAIIAAVLVPLSGAHVTISLAGVPVAVPVPVLALAVVLAVIGVLCLLIRRAARAFPLPPLPSWRIT